MSDQVRVDAPPPLEVEKRTSLFYPHIANNMLMFHGTPSQSKRDSILANGLCPPSAASVSQTTLARRMSLSGDSSYGGSGYIFAFRPQVSEVDHFYPQWGRSMQIKGDLSKLPKERIIFYLDGKKVGDYKEKIFQQPRDVLKSFIDSGYNQSVFEAGMKPLITDVEQLIREQATFVDRQPAPEEIAILSQEIVWNELCCAVTAISDNVRFIGKELGSALKQKPNASISELTTLLGKEGGDEVDLFDIDTFLSQIQLLLRVPTIQGLGFEEFNYDIQGNFQTLQQQLQSLKDKEAESNRKQQEQQRSRKDAGVIAFLRARIKNLGRKK